MIDSAEALGALVDRARRAQAVAVDTEFVWERTYYPRLGLVQVGFEDGETALIDTPAIRDLSALGALMADPDVEKVLHDAGQDLQILHRATGALPASIFDTQLAAGFVGLTSTASLADLLEALVGVRLDKTQTRTDWLRRPLSDKQQDYARDDVRYLVEARDLLAERLQRLDRMAWFAEESEAYTDPERYTPDDPRSRVGKLRAKGVGRLSGQQKTLLRELVAWREEQAQRSDRPRRHVVPDETLVDLALQAPTSAGGVRRLRSISDKAAGRYGADIASVIESALDLPPQPRRPRSDQPGDDALARARLAQAFLTGQALRHELDPALLANKSELDAIVHAADPEPEDHRLLSGWRRTFIGDDLLRVLSGEAAVRVDPQSGLPTLS